MTAAADSHLLCLDREPFFELLEEYPEISQHIMQLPTRRLRRALMLSVRDDALGGGELVIMTFRARAAADYHYCA